MRLANSTRFVVRVKLVLQPVVGQWDLENHRQVGEYNRIECVWDWNEHVTITKEHKFSANNKNCCVEKQAQYLKIPIISPTVYKPEAFRNSSLMESICLQNLSLAATLF